MKKPYAVVRSAREQAFEERRERWAAACLLNPLLARRGRGMNRAGAARRKLRDVLRHVPKSIRRHEGAGSMVKPAGAS